MTYIYVCDRAPTLKPQRVGYCFLFRSNGRDHSSSSSSSLLFYNITRTYIHIQRVRVSVRPAKHDSRSRINTRLEKCSFEITRTHYDPGRRIRHTHTHTHYNGNLFEFMLSTDCIGYTNVLLYRHTVNTATGRQTDRMERPNVTITCVTRVRTFEKKYSRNNIILSLCIILLYYVSANNVQRLSDWSKKKEKCS